MTELNRPFSEACERNKAPILSAIRHLLDGARVLEIGTGTAQHATHFVANVPTLHWQCSDRSENLAGIEQWRAESDPARMPPALELDVAAANLAEIITQGQYNLVYTANTAHIMQPQESTRMWQHIDAGLNAGAHLVQYGPFTREGQHTSPSNADFDQRLRAAGYGGYRDISGIVDCLPSMTLEACLDMPANNYLLIFKK